MRCWSITESKADCYVKICLVDETGAGDGALSVLAARWGLEHDEENLMALVMTPEHLELRKRDEPKLGGIFVDFVGGAMAHRRKFGGGRGEAVAKAVGIKGSYLPDVVDATAGLGRDAFVLASVGCRVRMLERNPVVAALLDDGLTRGYADPEIGPWLQERLQLIHASSLTALTDITPRPQVVYLDPMFPHKQKSALVKKRDACVSVVGGARFRCRWPAGTGSSAGDEAGGGEAAGLCAAAGGRCDH